MEDNLRSYRRISFQGIWYLSRWFYKKCKDNANEAINITIEDKKLQKMYGDGTRIICASGQATSKVFEINFRK